MTRSLAPECHLEPVGLAHADSICPRVARSCWKRCQCAAATGEERAHRSGIAVAVAATGWRNKCQAVNAGLEGKRDIEAHSHIVLRPYLPVGEDGRPIPDEQFRIIGKNRNGGLGSLPVNFDERRLQFLDRVEPLASVPATSSSRSGRDED